MSTIKDLLQSIFDSTRERVKSPIIGTYITSFFIYNWRPIIFLLFSEANIEDKFIVMNDKYCDIWQFIIPLIMTSIYIGIFPFLNLKLEKSLEEVNESRLVEKHKVLISKLKKKAEIATQERIIEAERAGTESITNLKNEIDSLRNEKQSLIENYNTERQQFKDQVDILHKRTETYDETLRQTQTYLADIQFKYNDLRAFMERIYVDRMTLPEDELFNLTIASLPDIELESISQINEQNEKRIISLLSDLSSTILKKAKLLQNNFEGGYSLSEKGKRIVERLKRD